MPFESLPIRLGQLIEARAGDQPLNRVHASEDEDDLRVARPVHQLVEQQNPQEIDLSQDFGSPRKTYDTTTQTHADTSALHHSRKSPISKHGGVIHEESELMPRCCGDAIHSGTLQEKTTPGDKHEQITGDSLQGSNQQREFLTYPEGEDNAVTITEKDMEGLEPRGCLSNNIVDFYMRYLERTISLEIGHRFYFFNNYFFTKLLKSTACTSINHSKVDYEQLRKWIGGENLFEKDYIFIPVIKSGHWSLIVICHLSSLTSSNGEKGSPYMLHLDPLEAQHESFESQVRSYILEAWRDNFALSDNMDGFIALSLMKYIQCEVPRQTNNYDCGLYLLHYIEVFLQKSTSHEFKFDASDMGVNFMSPNFVEEVCAKRMHIQNLIHKLREISEVQNAKRLTIQNLIEELSQTSRTRLTFENFVEELSEPFQRLQTYMEHEGCFKRPIKIVRNCSQTMSFEQDIDREDAHVFIGGNAIEVQNQQCLKEVEATDHQTTWRLGLEVKPQDGEEVGDVEYQTRSKTLLVKQLHENVPYMMQCGGLKTSIRNIPWADKQALEGSIEGVQNHSPILFNGQCNERKRAIHLSNGESIVDDQQQQCLIEDELKNCQSTWGCGLEDSSQCDARKARQRNQNVVGKYQQQQTPCVMLEHSKDNKKRKWAQNETSLLLSCKVDKGRFCKENRSATHWKLISQEIGEKLGTLPSEEQCRRRYETLHKAYKAYKKYCTNTEGSGELLSGCRS